MESKLVEELKKKIISQLENGNRRFRQSGGMELKKEQIEEFKKILEECIVPFNLEINCWEDSWPPTYILEEKEKKKSEEDGPFWDYIPDKLDEPNENKRKLIILEKENKQLKEENLKLLKKIKLIKEILN